MKKSIKILIVITVLIVVIFTAFFAGMTFANKVANQKMESITTGLTSLNTISAYRVVSEISESIASGKNNHAKCVADLTASAYFREIQECWDDSICRSYIPDEVKVKVPELLNKSQIVFKYYNDLEQCSSN